MKGRDIMKGRHGVGGRIGTAGKIRSAQGPSGSGVGTGVNVTTGARPEWGRAKPFTPNAKDTSADEERFIKEAPDPFKDSQNTTNIPAPRGPRGAEPGLEPKGVYAGKTGSRAQANPSGGAVGQSRLPNQRYQIGGRMAFPPPARKAGKQSTGYYKVRGRSAFYGE